MAAPTVLLTGATGFIGGATPGPVIGLAAGLPGTRTCPGTVAQTRLPTGSNNPCPVFIGHDRAEDALRQCEVIPGDLTNPASLGTPRLDEATHVIHLASLKKLAGEQLDEVTHVLHLASNTNFKSVRNVRHTNVIGALSLAHRMRRVKNLQRFLYVGTALHLWREFGAGGP
jgi:nucleoside-diphosphate-sugar epimerase